jgi:hypothetical protein
MKGVGREVVDPFGLHCIARVEPVWPYQAFIWSMEKLLDVHKSNSMLE